MKGDDEAPGSKVLITPYLQVSVEIDPTGDDEDEEALVCPKCHGASPLNDIFCLLCGTRIPPDQADVRTQTELRPVRGISQIQHANAQHTSGIQIPPFLTFAVVMVAGFWLGIVLGNQQVEKAKAAAVPIELPPRGLALLTAKPNCDVFIELPTHRAFLLGCTGPDGDVTVKEDLEAGEYQLTLDSGDAHTSVPFSILDDSPTILGGPPGPKLLSQAP